MNRGWPVNGPNISPRSVTICLRCFRIFTDDFITNLLRRVGYPRWQTHRQTNRQTDRRAHHNTSHRSCGGREQVTRLYGECECVLNAQSFLNGELSIPADEAFHSAVHSYLNVFLRRSVPQRRPQLPQRVPSTKRSTAPSTATSKCSFDEAFHGAVHSYLSVFLRRSVPRRRPQLPQRVPSLRVRHVDGPARRTVHGRLPRGLPQQHRTTHPRTAGDRRSAQGDGDQLVDGQVRPDHARRRGPSTLVSAPGGRCRHVGGDAQQRTVVWPVPERARSTQARTSDLLQRHAGRRRQL